MFYGPSLIQFHIEDYGLSSVQVNSELDLSLRTNMEPREIGLTLFFMANLVSRIGEPLFDGRRRLKESSTI